MDSLMEYYKNACIGDICSEYKALWRGCGQDNEKLIRLALNQQSQPHMMHYSYMGKGLTKEYITERFKDYINGRRTLENCDMVSGYTYQLFVDYNGIVDVTSDVTTFMYCDDVTLVVPITKCPVIYCGCKTKMHIVANGYNTLKIYLFDESTVTIDDTDNDSKVTVFRYSDDARVEKGCYCFGTVKDFRKELRL